jgi:hypothetical protein
MTINITVKKFSPSETHVAKKIVDDFVLSRKLLNASVGNLALPSQFVYTFCGLNDNEDKLRAANSKRDVNALFSEYEISFSAIAYPEYDQHLSPLFDNLFPVRTEELMELLFEFKFSKPTSIKDFVAMLAQVGFVYNQNSVYIHGNCPDECFLKDLMKEFVFI